MLHDQSLYEVLYNVNKESDYNPLFTYALLQLCISKGQSYYRWAYQLSSVGYKGYYRLYNIKQRKFVIFMYVIFFKSQFLLHTSEF